MSLKILAFDTATRATSVALALSDREPALELRDDPNPGERPRHTTRLLPLIGELLGQASASFDELDRIAVGVGPGTFTGLRIGIATARALAQARSIPLVGISTLHSLAVAVEGDLASEDDVACGYDVDTVTPVIDARRGEVFAATWSARHLERTPLVAARAVEPDALARLLSSNGIEAERTLAIGDGALTFRSVLEHSGVQVPGDDSGLHLVTATNHCRLARSLSPRRRDLIQPCYLRSPDARPSR
jgi:tRNA threonylcarbamoyladenosine biosynthesis protein TsaB